MKIGFDVNDALDGAGQFDDGTEVAMLGVVSLGWVESNRLECDLTVVGPFIEPDVPGEVRCGPFATFLVYELA